MTVASHVPIANVYYLLAYAWNYFASEDETNLISEECPDSENLLGFLLARRIEHLSRRGLDRAYVPLVEETPRLRGRILVAESERRFTRRAGRMICELDELSEDIHANRILRSTCDRLLQRGCLTRTNQARIRNARELLLGVSSIRLTSRSFHRVQLHRNNRHYRFLIQICQLLFETQLVDQKNGLHRFADFLRNEKRMAGLFEQFVRSFARRNLRKASIKAEKMNWSGRESWSADAQLAVPSMKTDLTIKTQDWKAILDCKFYVEAMTGKDCRKIRTGHLYQLNAYLQNKRLQSGWEDVEGILLYPAVQQPIDTSFDLLGQPTRIVTVNLDKPWRDIESELRELLSPICHKPTGVDEAQEKVSA